MERTYCFQYFVKPKIWYICPEIGSTELENTEYSGLHTWNLETENLLLSKYQDTEKYFWIAETQFDMHNKKDE